VFSCSPKKTNKSDAKSNSNEISAGENTGNRRSTLQLAEKGEQKDSAIQTAERDSKVFFSQGFVKRRVPDDFKIGPMEDYYGKNAERRTILSQVDLFCLGLTNNELIDSLLDAQNRSLLVESLQYYLNKEIMPGRYRIGLVQINEDGSSHVPVRLLSNRGGSEGDIYLVKREDTWLITDIQVDLQRLEQQYVPRKEEFVPASYDLLFNNTF
jgi:hypothetical protein